MTLLLLVLAVHADAAPAKPELRCVAVHRSLDAHDDTLEHRAPLSLQPAPAGLVLHEATLDGRTFSLTEDRGDLFAQIRRPGPDAAGLAVRGSLDRQGRFSAAEVAGFQAFRLECARSAN